MPVLSTYDARQLPNRLRGDGFPVVCLGGLADRVQLILTQPGGGHYPWLDDPALFTTKIATFLER